MKLSVCITAYDQNELTIVHIKECMNSLRIPDEIIVVNDGGSDELEKMVEEIPDKKCSLIYAKIEQDILWNQCGARNLGIYLSTGDLIALEDNDHIPSKDFYKQAEELINNGYDRVVGKKRWVVPYEDALKQNWNVIGSRGKAVVISFCRREFLLDIKGFDENFVGNYGWDVPDFNHRMNFVGAKTIYSGSYYVVDCYSNMKNRTFYGDTKITKMAAVNYHTYKGTCLSNVSQSTKGILNFNFRVKRL